MAFILDHDEYFSELINQAGDDASDLKDIIRQKALASESGKKLIDFARKIGIEEVEISEADMTQEEGRSTE